jgi:hypothetical protein
VALTRRHVQSKLWGPSSKASKFADYHIHLYTRLRADKGIKGTKSQDHLVLPGGKIGVNRDRSFKDLDGNPPPVLTNEQKDFMDQHFPINDN